MCGCCREMCRPLLLEQKRRTTPWLRLTNVFATQPNTAPISFLPKVNPCTCDRRTDGQKHSQALYCLTVSSASQMAIRSSYTLQWENKPMSETVLCVVRPRWRLFPLRCTGVQSPGQVLLIIKLHYTNMLVATDSTACGRHCFWPRKRGVALAQARNGYGRV